MGEPITDLVWMRAGRSLTGSGGWRLAFDGPDRLRRIDRVWRRLTEQHAGDPLVAFFCAVFDDASALPSVLRVPAVVVRDGIAYAQTLDPRRLAAAVAGEDVAVGPGAVPVAPGSSLDAAGYRAAVVAAERELRRGQLRKVVLSRDTLVPADDTHCRAALGVLAERYPQTWTFAVDGLFGATPELMVARRGYRFVTRVLAGTAVDDATLLGDPRRAEEHRLAADAVVAELRRFGELDDDDPQPYALQLPNLWHLATDIAGRVRDPRTSPLEVVAALHPTPAVAGVPAARSVALIAELEPRDRGRYAGPVGWFDSAGNGEVGLALRCGQREPGGVRLYAGGGIVAGADPDWEYVETEVKLTPMLAALNLD